MLRDLLNFDDRRRVFTIGLTAVALLVAAPGAVSAQTDEGLAGSAAGGHFWKPTDEEITDAVDTALLLDPAVLSHQIDVMTAEGIVTLTGGVDHLLAKERAAKVARTVSGVRAVVNRIELSAPVRPDGALRRDVEQALFEDPATDSYEIDVSVDDGTVSLRGEVDSFAERRLAGIVAKGVRGVTELDNRLGIDYDEERTVPEISAEVRKVLRWDRFIDDGLINVSVADDVVRLTGVVGSAAERQRARWRAWVRGVRKVDVSGLKVERWARDPDMRKNKYVRKSDEELEDAVRDALLWDPRVLGTKVDVDVDQGVASLSGKVESLAAKRAASRDARGTVGIWRVENHLKVRPGGDLSDVEIAGRVRNALLRDPWLESYEIGVRVDNGIVTLTGTVDDFFEKGQADDVVSRTAGVVAVKNKLYIDYDHSPVPWTPYVSEWYPYDYEWYHVDPLVRGRSDYDIRRSIENELKWSPFVDEEDVTVMVEDGTATLTGEVETWAEYGAARENALEGGAVNVVNKLRVNMGFDWRL